jgi:hypothetical protein
MKLVLLFFYLSSILVSTVMAFVYRKQLRSKNLYVLLPFLVLVFFQELIVNTGGLMGYITSNSVIYNIYRPITAIVFAFVYYRIPFMSPWKKLIAGLTILYLTITFINYCFIESIFTTSSYLTLARGFVITFCAVLFLFSYFNLDNLAQEKYWRPLVWVTIGVVIFYPVISISTNFQKYLAATSATLYGMRLYQLIPQVMSIFMYSCFSYAFYLCKKEN